MVREAGPATKLSTGASLSLVFCGETGGLPGLVLIHAGKNRL